MRSGSPFIAVLLLAAVPALTQPEPQNPPTEPAPPLATADQDRVNSDKALDSGVRIVDPTQFPPKPSLASRIFMAPFRAIGPGLERRLTRMEQQHPILRVQHIFSNPYALPRVGSLGDGSGFGLGANLSSGDLISRDFRLVSSVHVTGKRYFFGHAWQQQSWKVFPSDLEHTVRLLIESGDPLLKRCAIGVISMFGLRSFDAALDGCANDSDPLVQEAVRQARSELHAAR